MEEFRDERVMRSEDRLEGPNYQVLDPDSKHMPLLEQALDRLHVLLKSKRHRIDHVNVATLLHQLGTLAVESNMKTTIIHHPITKDLFELVLEKLNEFEAMHVGNIIWAFACLGRESLQVQFGSAGGFHVVESLLMHAVRIISSFIPQSIAQLAHSLGQLDVLGAREFMPLLAVVAKPQLDGFTPWDSSVFLYALAQLRYEDHVLLLPSLVRRLENSIDRLNDPQQVANITWALFKLQVKPKGLVVLLERMQNWSMEHMEKFKTLEMACYVGSMVRLQFFPDPGFLEKLDDYCLQNQEKFSPNEVSTLLVACANLGHTPHSLIDGLQSIENYDETQDVPSTTVMIVWSLAMLEQLTLEHMKWAAHYLDKHPLRFYAEARRVQLAQTLITLQIAHPKIKLGEILSPALVKVIPLASVPLHEASDGWQACLHLWHEVQSLSGVPALMRAYLYAMQRLGYHCEARFIENGYLSTSTAINPAGHRIAIEVDPHRKRFINAPDKVALSPLTHAPGKVQFGFIPADAMFPFVAGTCFEGEWMDCPAHRNR